MGKLKLSNANLIIGGLLITTFCLSLLLLVSFITKGYIHNYAIAQLGAAGDFFNGIVSPFISIVSAILIYIAFKQQVDQNEIQTKRFEKEVHSNNLQRDFELYIKLIEDLEKYEQRIVATIFGRDEIIRKESGINAVKLYREFIEIDGLESLIPDDEKNEIDTYEFYKTFLIHLTSLSFILKQIDKFKNEHSEFYTILVTKVILITPLLYEELDTLIHYQDAVTYNFRHQTGIKLYNQIVYVKKQIDDIKII